MHTYICSEYSLSSDRMDADYDGPSGESVTRGSSSEQQSYEKLHRVSDCCAGLVSTPEHESEEVDTLQIIWMRLLFEFNDLIRHG